MSLRVAAGLTLVLTCIVVRGSAADVVDAIKLDVVPERLGYQPPRYPVELGADGPSAEVHLSVVVGVDGGVQAIENIVAPRAEFDVAARTAVAQWRFSAGLVGGQPVMYRLPVTVPFRTEGVEGGLSSVAGGASHTIVEEPVIEWEVAPAYPAEFATDPRDGIAVVNVLIDAIGTPSDAVVEYASHPAFAAAAVPAVLSWKFKPAESRGGLVAARTQVSVRFRKADAALTAEDRKRHAQLARSQDFDIAPEELIQVPLVYPYAALLKSERGTVSLNVLVSPEGRVVNIEQDPGSISEFALAADACVTCWTFHPATKNGEPVFGLIKWQLVFADDSGELQWDDAGRELLAQLRAGTFKSASPRELDQPITPRERIVPQIRPGLGARANGDVIIEAIIDRNGRTQFPRVVSAPTPEVGYAAATAALRWRFDPPRKGGQPVSVRVRIPFKIAIPDVAPAGQ